MADYTNTMKNKTDYLSMVEVNKMLDYCYGRAKNRLPGERIGIWERNYFLILTLLRTGRRISEILGIKPYDNYTGFRPVDIQPDGLIEFDILKKGHIKRKNKNGTPRKEHMILKDIYDKKPKRKLFPVDDTYLELIQGYIKRYNIPPYYRIFDIHRSQADRIIKHVAASVNVQRPQKGIHAHSFRHTFSIHFLKKKPNDAAALSQLQDLLDHSDIKVTMHYAQFTPYDKKEALNHVWSE